MKLYFDSSALTKRYIFEKGSEEMDRFFLETDSVAVSSICLPEIISAFTRLLRENKISGRQYDQCKRKFIEDFTSFEVCQVSAEVLKRSITILEHTELRAADAVHVASAMEMKVDIFISGDKKQILAAKKFNLMVNSV